MLQKSLMKNKHIYSHFYLFSEVKQIILKMGTISKRRKKKPGVLTFLRLWRVQSRYSPSSAPDVRIPAKDTYLDGNGVHSAAVLVAFVVDQS